MVAYKLPKSSYIIKNISAISPLCVLSFNILGRAQTIILFGANDDTDVIDDVNISVDTHFSQ